MYDTNLTSVGASFQPGQGQTGPNSGNGHPGGGGVQEAIKILSLRLPRVLGAQASVAAPLLTSPGSGGDRRVDDVISRAMRKVMGTGGPNFQQPTAPVMATGTSSGPNFSGVNTPYRTPRQSAPWQPPANFTPRVIIGGPLAPRYPGQQSGTDADLSPGGFQPPGMFEELPEFRLPTPPQNPGRQVPLDPAPVSDDPFYGYPNREI